MKLLESGRLEAVSSLLSNLEFGDDIRIVGSVESYSCKVKILHNDKHRDKWDSVLSINLFL